MPLDREIWLYVVCAITTGGLVWGLHSARRVIEVPFLYSVGLALILCPQMYIVARNPWRVPDDAFWAHNVMFLLSTACLYLGYFTRGGVSAFSKPKLSTERFDNGRLFWFGGAVAALGTVGYFQLLKMGEVEVWRGWSVYWATLSGLTLPGLSLMVIAYFETRDRVKLLLVLLLSIFPLLAVVLHGRRSMAFDLPLLFLVPFIIYHPAFRPRRAVVIAALVAAFVVIYAFPYWRGSFQDMGHIQVLSAKPLGQIMADVFGDGSEKNLELVDSMIVVGARLETSNYEWLLPQLYNRVVELYVPGSLIGYDVKNTLRLGEGVSVDWVERSYDLSVRSYIVKNGYSDAFGQFSFFGALLFYFVGRILGRTSYAARQRRDPRAIIVMCFFISVPAGIAYGSTFSAIANWLPTLAIMFIVFRLCIKRTPANFSRRQRRFIE